MEVHENIDSMINNYMKYAIIDELKNKAMKYTELPLLDSSEKDMIFALSHLLDYFYLLCIKAQLYTSVNLDKVKALDDKITEVSERLDKFLYSKYQPKEFSILNVVTFSKSSLFISTLLENMCFYFMDYEFDKNMLSIYYYLFHLSYYILSIIVKDKKDNCFRDDIIKFYIYHIIHFFVNDHKNPEYNFFFYEGALKYLAKDFNISVCFLFDIKDKTSLKLKNTKDIIEIISNYHSELVNKISQNENELNFIGNYSKIYKEIEDIINEKINIKKEKSEENELLRLCLINKKHIEKVSEILTNNKVSCPDLDNYKKTVEKLIGIIQIKNLTLNHFNLMTLNYDCKDYTILDLERLYKLATKWEDYYHSLNQDYTEEFSKIIPSSDFKELYLTSMKSKYVKDFAKENNLTSSYNIFMNKYADELYKYILYVPLTKGIKAYVSNYFRIAININSVDIIDISDDKIKEEILKSYLLIILIHESFLFIFRINKEGDSASETISPLSKKIKECYKEIGVDIILYIFGTEYITFISEENSKLLNNLESWKKDNTNFKVFKEVYLFCGELIDKDKKNPGSGLKCNISVNENKKIQWKMCTDGAVRFCF